MKLISQKETVSTIFLGFSILSSGLALLHTGSEIVRASVTFHFELRFFIILCALCSLIVYWFDRPIVVVLAHLLHVASIIIIARLLNGLFLILELIICLPILLETAIYLEIVPGIVLNGLLLILLSIADLIAFRGRPSSEVFGHLSISTVIIMCISGIGAALIYYRETIVRYSERISVLRSSVLQLSEANRAFQVYADHVESQSATDERNRITRELHDTIGYALTNVIMSMNAGPVLSRTDPEKLQNLFRTTKQQAEEALRETRQTLYRLRAVHETDPTGINGISRLTKAFEAASDISVTMSYGNVPTTFGPRIDAVIYRIVQEGLTNAFRHGSASSVKISMWQDDEKVQISVWDNGRGNAVIEEGIGLLGMRERLAELGGVVEAHNVSDGFKLSATIPYREYRIDGQDTRSHS